MSFFGSVVFTVCAGVCAYWAVVLKQAGLHTPGQYALCYFSIVGALVFLIAALAIAQSEDE